MPKSIVQELTEKGTARLKEIRETVGPMIEEEAQLASMLGETNHYAEAGKEPVAIAAPEPVAPAGNGTPAPAAAPKRRSRKGGTRAEQAVELIAGQPGISASDVAKSMGVKPNYLYRVLDGLVKENRLRKQDRQYFPVSA
jgi:hypothetical protein